MAYHLGIKSKQCCMDNTLKAVTVHATHHPWPKIKAKLARADRHSNMAFVCIQSLDQGTPEVQDALLTWLDTRIPELDLKDA